MSVDETTSGVILTDVEPVEILKECASNLIILKNNTSSIFSELEQFFFSTGKEITNFNNIMKPYTEYFNTDKNDPSTLLNSVITPSMNEINLIVDRTIGNMDKDNKINDNVIMAIEKVITIQDLVDNILNIVDDIEIYFLNTMFISIKIGEEGLTLIQLSKEMGKLSSSISELSKNLKVKFKELNSYCINFSQIRSIISTIYESNVASMKVTSKLVIIEIMEMLNNISTDIRNIFSQSIKTERYIKKLINKFQMEDITRQDTEKVIFLTEFFIEKKNDLFKEEIGSHQNKRYDQAIICLAGNKIKDIKKNIDSLNKDIDECLNMIVDVCGKVIMKFSEKNESKNQNGKILRDVYKSVKNIQDEFVKNITEIILDKKKLNELSQDIIEIVNKFDEFFNTILSIARKFEVINLLTRIELVRNSKILKTLGGALSEISKLPMVIKNKVGQSFSLYNKTKIIVSEAINEYFDSFSQQNMILDECIKNISTISEKLSESEKQYFNISDKIINRSQEALKFIDAINEKKQKLFESAELLNFAFRKLEPYWNKLNGDYNFDINSYAIELNIIRQNIKNFDDQDKYKLNMVLSLFSEYLDKNDNVENIQFF